MSQNLPPNNQRFYIALGVMAALVLVCIGAFTYVAGAFTSKIPEGAPTNTPLPPPVVSIQKIKAQAELSTVEYSTITEVYNETPPEGIVDEFLGNREKLLMLVYGDVQAGFDLSELSDEDIWSDGKKVRLVLPAPKILNSSIDFDRTHIVYYENKLIFDSNNPNLQGEALKQAKDAIEEAALKEGILNRANDYGRLYYQNFLYSLGFTDVEVVVNAQIFKK
ncbi:MAG: hypothetical protein FOGNACKC_03518 [Anaerolineae bacterium]|nr:hypothetical protein [Anaerolineae bacterium]